jgi:hypothetical protein
MRMQSAGFEIRLFIDSVNHLIPKSVHLTANQFILELDHPTLHIKIQIGKYHMQTASI